MLPSCLSTLPCVNDRHDRRATELIAMTSYYYTTNKPRANRHSYNKVIGWKLDVNYREGKINTPNKLMKASSVDKKFRIPGIPRMFDTEEDALAMGAEFRRLVENIVRGDRPLRTHASGPRPVPPQFERKKEQLVASFVQFRVCGSNGNWKSDDYRTNTVLVGKSTGRRRLITCRDTLTNKTPCYFYGNRPPPT